MSFLPITKKEMECYGWEYPDIVLVTGDAYVDHPSFGTAIISRVLEHAGFKVAILSQPQNDEDYKRFGKPRLAFFVNSGNIDSMVAHYTVAKRKRSEDAYTAGGKSGKRPDRALKVYSKAIRRVYGDIPICIGGLEASLRRFAHYDYWDDKVHPSILIDSAANLLMYGMGEKQVVEIAVLLNDGVPINEIRDIKGTCYAVDNDKYEPLKAVECPSFEIVSAPTESGKRQYVISTRMELDEHDAVRGKKIIQKHGTKIVIQNEPMPPLTTEELDEVYSLPYERNWHPSYDTLGGVPGLKEVKFSVTHCRGCFGACNFCSIAYHQGRQIAVRSEQSVLDEVKKLTAMPDFKGYIHDVGGPTANFRRPSCEKQLKAGLCAGKKCLAPTPCPNLSVDHSEYLHLLREIRKIPKVKKVFIRSGIRFDYLICDSDDEFFEELVKYHVSGQLKVAPEHCSENVLSAMGKPSIKVYEQFRRKYFDMCQKAEKEQYLVPYLMSSHPGSTIKDAIELSLFIKKEGLHPEQVQDFYPTPGTISTAMFYTGLDPYTLKPIYVPRTAAEKADQRALLQYYLPENRATVLKALRKAGRYDLIGTGKDCLIKDNRPAAKNQTPKKKKVIRNVHKKKNRS